MQLVELHSKAEKKSFTAFRAELYRGDPGYVCTEKFVLNSVLFRETDFVRSCQILPVQVREGNRVLAQAIVLRHPGLPYIQISFFDALPDCGRAVDMLAGKAREWEREQNAQGIIVGLNAHISYGVGILSEGFDRKNSFDSQYNKSYYREYFAGCRKDTLSTYKCPLERAIGNFPRTTAGCILVRSCNLRRYREETELMRALCEKTIAKTHLYFPTAPLHFYQLTGALKAFLRPENLLFAENEQGETLGFLFWHPDYNQMLAAGREYSLAEIAGSWLFHRKRIDTVKVNALGSLSYRATFALLDRFRQYVQGKYAFVETNFVWDNNLKSSLMMHRLFGTYDRKYEVYYL